MARPSRSAAGSSPALHAEIHSTSRRPTRTSGTAQDLSASASLKRPSRARPSFPRAESSVAVVIPSRPREDVAKMQYKPEQDTRRVSNSTTSLSSVNEASLFSRDISEVETPETSAISTPAELATGPRRQFPRGHVFENPFASQGKGKRQRASTNTEGDAALAQALQEEEYRVTEASASKPAFKKRRVIDLDSDVESIKSASSEDVPLAKRRRPTKRASSDDVESVMSDSSEDVPLARSRKPNVLNRSKPRPTRKAGSSAQKAVKKTVAAIGDSEGDDSGLSDFVDDDGAVPNASDVKHFAGISDEESDMDEPEEQADALDYEGYGEDWEEFRSRMARSRKSNRAMRERYKLERSHPEIKTMWDTLEAVPRIQKEEAEQPTSINRKLKSFQLEGLNWMKKQEQTQWRGGLLGDEMGMGKTIQAVSLIMSDYPTKPHKPTLVVVPPVALMQWTNEINDYTSGQLKVLLYHGQNAKAKQMSVKELKAYDVIMISYSGLESAYRKQEKGWTRKDKIVKETSAIHDIDFHRLILDEAHSIKSRTTGVAKACFALKGSYKWCLSGTPVQNRIGEFFSLLRFLEVTPFANYFCKECPCAKIDWQTTPDYRCTSCKHRTLSHVSVFNQEILNPIVQGDTDAERKNGLRKLRLLTDYIMLRRMKRDQTASMELPPKEIIVHNEFFGEIERDFSSSIMSNTARQFDTYVSRGVMLNNYANIFGLIMQMRQVADHPDLLLKKHADLGQNVLVCNICDEAAEEAIRSRCKHDFCRVCAKDYVRTCEASGATPDCPRCHISLSIDFDQPDIEQDTDSVKRTSIINRIKMENWTSSTKIEMLVYDLYKLRSKKTTLKSIVFSQFTSMLQLIEWRLRRAGFNTVMLDGSMTPQQRQKSIEYFMNNTDVEVFLVSLKAGGVALNLTEASRVFIVDPWWNPAAEWQSADRCHRIGQRRPCVITRLCVEDSVESRIVMLQEKKANLIQGTVNNDEVAMDKLSPEDMQFLFRGS